MRNRISKNRSEGFKNPNGRPNKHYRKKMTFEEWVENGLERCRFNGGSTYVDLEYRQVFIRWSKKETVIRTIDDMYQEYRDEYCNQWK